MVCVCGWFGSRCVLCACLVVGVCPIRLGMCYEYILTKYKPKMLHVAGHDATWTAIEWGYGLNPILSSAGMDSNEHRM